MEVEHGASLAIRTGLRVVANHGTSHSVTPWPDHLRCVPLPRWLPHVLGGGAVAHWVAPPRKGWRAPRALRRFVAEWPAWEPPEPCRALVVVRPLGPPEALPRAFAELPSEVVLVELATLPRMGWFSRLRPVHVRLRATRLALERFHGYLTHGGAGLQQWVSPGPHDVLVTACRFSPRVFAARLSASAAASDQA